MTMDNFGIAVSGLRMRWGLPNAQVTTAFLGGRIRGILGWALWREVCPHEEPRCQHCALAPHCPYPEVFKPVVPDRLAGYILHDWRQSGAVLEVSVLLLGHCRSVAERWVRGLARHLPKFLWGYEKGLVLIDVHDWQSGAAIYSHSRGFLAGARVRSATDCSTVPAAASVKTGTPLISKHSGPDPLLPALRTRLNRLRKQFGDGSVLGPATPLWNGRVLEQRAVRLRIGDEQRLITGISGTFRLEGITPEGAALLGAGLWLHGGGQTGFGFGRYSVRY